MHDVGFPGVIRSDDASALRVGLSVTYVARFASSKGSLRLIHRGVVERGLTLIDKVAKPFTIQVQVSFVSMKLLMTGSLWPEVYIHAYDVLNRTATTTMLDNKSPYEMWYDKASPPTPLEGLQPCFSRIKRKHGQMRKLRRAFT